MLDYVYGETSLLHTVSSIVDICWTYEAIPQTLAEFRLVLYPSKLIFQLRSQSFYILWLWTMPIIVMLKTFWPV